MPEDTAFSNLLMRNPGMSLRGVGSFDGTSTISVEAHRLQGRQGSVNRLYCFGQAEDRKENFYV